MIEGAGFVGWSDLCTGLLLIALALPLVRRRVPMNRWYGVLLAALAPAPLVLFTLLPVLRLARRLPS